MRSRAVAIFGVSYAVSLIVVGGLAIFAMRLAGWDASHKDSADTIWFVLNMAAFASALRLALSRRIHAYLGVVPGPIAFSRILSEGYRGLSVGIAIIAVLIEICLYAFSFWYFTGEIKMPPVHRMAIRGVVYGVMGAILISEVMKRR